MDYIEKHDGAELLDSWIFWDEASAANHRRAHQCHQASHGARRGNADFRRKTEYVAVDWGADSFLSFFMLERSGKKEGIDFKRNVWVYAVVGAAVMGALCALYDKFLMNPDGLGIDKLVVQSYYNFYQCMIMAVILLALWFPRRKSETPFQWRWSIIFISIFLCAADFVYFYALSLPDAMVSIVSMVRRSSVIVSFTFGALLFKEHNIRSKVLDLALVLLSLVFLWLGSE